MDFYSIENRIFDLYGSINFHIETYSVETVPEQKVFTDNEGKEIIQLSIGHKEISEEEKRKVFFQYIKPIIHHLANFKDNLKNLFGENNLNPKIVENAINNSKELSIIIDLSNQFKHGYPLKKRTRSHLNPKIDNIKYALNLKIPLAHIFHNPLSNDMIVDADIIDDNDNFIMPFTLLVEKSTKVWEDLIIKYLPNYANGILTKRNEKAILDNSRKKFQHLINEAKKILNNNEWVEIPYTELRPDMIVDKSNSSEVFDGFNKGIIRNILYEKSKYFADIITDNPIILNPKIELTSSKWKVLILKNPNDLVVLVHYYYSFANKYFEIMELEKKYSKKHY